MNRKRFTEEQIVTAINERDTGSKVDDICRKLGISNGTFYNWSSKFSGLDINKAKRLRELEAENIKIKRHLTEKLQEIEAMRDALSTNMIKACDRKAIATHMIKHHQVSEYRACLLSGISRTVYRYQATTKFQQVHIPQ